MKKFWQRPISFVLALLLMVTMVPFQMTAQAAERKDLSSIVTVSKDAGQGQTGIIESDGKWYAYDDIGAKIESGWIFDGEYYYWAKEDEDGALACDEICLTDNDKYAVFDTACHQVTDGWHTTSDGKTYYQDLSTGYRIATGIKMIEKTPYLFDDAGVLQKTASWQQIGENTYYLQSDGSLATGIVEIDGNRYGFTGEGVKIQNGWVFDGTYYYWAKAEANGVLACDEIYLTTDNNKYAVFDADGHQVTDGWYTTGAGKTYYQDVGTGYRISIGKKTIGDKVYLFDSNGVLDKTVGWREIEGKTYYLQPDGSFAVGIVEISGQWYAFTAEGVKVESGWVFDGTYYYWAKAEADGALARDEIYLMADNNKYAVFDVNGHQVTGGWYTSSDGKTYYQDVGTGYRISIGKKTIGGKIYLFGDDGVLQKNAGWQTNDGKHYYLQADGSFATGIGKIGEQRYAFTADGVKVESGWVFDGTYYYWAKADANGALACDESYLTTDNNKYAVFDTDGHQVTDGWYTSGDGKTYYQDVGTGYRVATGEKTINGKNYFFDAKGVLQARGWIETAEGSYYIKEDGNFATGIVEIDGTRYGFGEDGIKVESGWIFDGTYYYWAKADADGALACDESYLMTDNNKYAVFNQNCHQVTDGWYTTSDGKSYYQDAGTGYRVARGYAEVKGKLYYFGEAGVLFVPSAEGWYTKEDKKYYFRSDGSIVQPPVIDAVTTSVGTESGKIRVTINATFTDGSPAEKAYSFDGGASWQESSSKDFAQGSILVSGMIRVRDKNGYIVIYDEMVNLGNGSIGFGIDVSSHQGPIDWKAMAEDGVKFAIIRAVSWSKDGKSVVEDTYFRTNVRQAKENGILVGAYIYSYAFNTDEMKQEIDKFHTAMQALKAEGYTLDMPVFIDYEDSRLYSAAGCPANNTERTNIVRYGMQLLESYGYYPGFYTFYNFALNYLDYKQLMNEGYDFWLAHYGISQPKISGIEMWQYSSSLTVGGRNPIDGNYCYKDYTELIHGSGSGSHVEVEETLTVYDLNTGKVVTDTVTNILAQIVVNEIGGTVVSSATGEKAQRAYEVQAVAAHSWITYQYTNNYASEVNPPQVGLKPLSNISSQTYRDLIVAAVNKVKDDYITYNGEVALTPYYACSGGMTNSSADYWGRDLPYLQTVDLKSYEKDLINRTGLRDFLPVQMIRTRAQLQADILKVQPNADLSGSLSTWIQPYGRNDAGYYTKVKLGGVETDVDAFYEGVVGAYSLNFEMQVNGESSITFTSYGYGHCVGMSQYAMIQMAWLGMSASEITGYFYPGTEYQTI